LGILWPHSNSIIFNNAGARASGAKIHFFEAGTTTPRASYQDAALATPHTHPVIADASGRAPAIFLDYGDYRERIRSSGDTTIWDTDDIPNPTPVSDEDDVDPNAIFQTGDLIFAGKNGTRDGFVRWNGRSIGSATSAAGERANPDCEAAFLYLWNNFSNGQCPVSGGRGASAAADWAANKNITLPDVRTAALIGFDDMGNAARGGIDPALVVSGGLTAAGSIVGTNTHQLIESQLPVHSHSVSITSFPGGTHTHTVSGTTGGAGAHTHSGTTGTESTSHTHATSTGANSGLQAAVGSTGTVSQQYVEAATASTGLASNAHTHSFSTTSDPGNHAHSFTASSVSTQPDHTHLVSGNTGTVGSNFAHNIVQRSVPVTVLMKL
jgi:hypothetical protein